MNTLIQSKRRLWGNSFIFFVQSHEALNAPLDVTMSNSQHDTTWLSLRPLASFVDKTRTCNSRSIDWTIMQASLFKSDLRLIIVEETALRLRNISPRISQNCDTWHSVCAILSKEQDKDRQILETVIRTAEKSFYSVIIGRWRNGMSTKSARINDLFQLVPLFQQSEDDRHAQVRVLTERDLSNEWGTTRLKMNAGKLSATFSTGATSRPT